MALAPLFKIAEKRGERTQAASGKSMSLGEHLEELRQCIIRSFWGIIPAGLIGFAFGGDILRLIAEPMALALDRYGFPATMQTIEPSCGFGVWMTVCIITTLVIAAPWILLQLWRFISAGLYPRERRVVYILVPFSTVMAAIGILFSYFILLPVCLNFFVGFTKGMEPIHPGNISAPTKLMMEGQEKFNTWIYDASRKIPNERIQKLISDGPPPSMDTALPADPQPPALNIPVRAYDPKAEEQKVGDLWYNADQHTIKFKAPSGLVLNITAAPASLITPQPNLGEYISFASWMTLGTVAAFQIPVLMLVIGWTRLIKPSVIANKRKYAALGACIMAAMLTPSTDMFTMAALAVPVYLLFEGGLLLMRIVYRIQDKAAKAESEDLMDDE